MRIHHLNCGSMCPPFTRLRGANGGLLRRGEMVCHCLLLETEDGLALVDTGLGTRDVAQPMRHLGAAFVAMVGPVLSHDETALAQVTRLGFKPSDVRHIFPTHLDVDHAGGLADFPDATVHIYGPEHRAALVPRTFMERNRYRSVHWQHRPKWQTHELGGDHWLGFESVRAVPGTQDQVLLIPLLGHTRGHCGIAIEHESGWLLHAGDAYFAHDEIHHTPPRCPPVLAAFQRTMAVDDVARRANQARLRDLASTHREVQIICAHDASELHAAPQPTPKAPSEPRATTT